MFLKKAMILYKKFLLIVLPLLVFTLSSFADTPKFTPEEQAYLKTNPVVKIGVIASDAPYSMFEKGRLEGFSIDILNNIEQTSGIRFEYRMGNWSDLYNSFMNKELDAINAISYTDERAKSILFTDPYHMKAIAVFSRGGFFIKNFKGLESLKGKKVGIVKSVFYGDIVKKDKDINFIEYNTDPDLMKSLAFGWIDAVLMSELTGRYIARQNYLTNIKKLGRVNISELGEEDYRIGVQQDNKLLHGILSKSLNSIDVNELLLMKGKWINSLSFDDGEDKRLTDEEKQFIANHPAITIGMLVDYEPFSFEENGKITGYSKSLLDKISQYTGVKFLYETDSWSRLLKKFKEGKIDVISNISYTDERAEFTLYSKEYSRVPTVVFVRNDFVGYESIDSLKNKNVGITKDVFYKKDVKDVVGENLKEFDVHDTMLKDLSFGGIDAVVTSLNTGNNIIKKYSLVNIKIAGEFTKTGANTEDLHFGISKKYPLLQTIINKGLQSIPVEEKISLENRWLSAGNLKTKGKPVIFTEEEKEYLNKRGNIKLCIDPDWMPFEKRDENGNYTGISADFMDLIKQKISNRFEIVKTNNWSESLSFIEQHKCDILPLAMQTPSRTRYLNFTDPYLIIPNVVATSINAPFMNSIDDILDKPLGAVRGYSITEMLKRTYPGINIVEVDNEESGIRKLQNGEIYGFIGTMATIGYQIQKQRIVDIKISGRIKGDWELGVAVRKDDNILFSIFKKLVNSVTEEEKRTILNKWLSVKYDQGFNYQLFWKIMAIVLIFVIMTLFWISKTKKLNRKLQSVNEQLRMLSERDGLTSLYNRRYLTAHGESTFSICKRNNIGFYVAIIDIDHFKKINDTYGHLMGDECLRSISGVLTSYFHRQSDTVARFGGEEFAIICTNDEADFLVESLECIRKEVETRCVAYDNQSAQFTLSAGYYGKIPEMTDTFDEFLSRADEALYKAKRTGRNKIVKG